MSIRLRHSQTGALLASLPQNYSHPGSSLQQMVGGSAKRDHQSIWLVKPGHDNQGNHLDGQAVSQGNVIRLEHVPTHRNLHSHNAPAPLTGPDQWEVTAFSHQAEGVGDGNDDWVVRLNAPGQWMTGSLFRLRHVLTTRFLHSHGLADPNRTAGMFEATTVADGDLNDQFVCLEPDLPALDGQAPAAVAAASPETGGLVERFKQHWLIAMIIYSGILIGITWAIFSGSLLAISERDLASTRDDRDRVVGKLGEANAENAQLRADTAELRKTLGHRDTGIASLQRQLEGRPKRRLTNEQIASVAKLLSGEPTGGVGVSYHRGDPAGDGLSGDIARTLEKAGFKTWSGFYDEFTPERGIWLEIPATSYRPDLVTKLQAAFKTVGIELQLKINEAVKKPDTELEIHITN
ncbi:MAG: MIR domain-containing protein [Opitutaceae bacterium]